MTSSTAPMLPTPLRVRAVEQETRDVVTLTLTPEGRRWAFQPGQFNMLYAFGVGEVAISISGDPAEDDRLVHTIRAVGATTKALCALAPGKYLGVRGPYGSGWPMQAARNLDLIMIAGGVGLAPLRAAVHHAIAHRGDYRRVFLLVGARAPEELLFQRELAIWRKNAAIDVLVTVDRAPLGWADRVGVVPALLPEIDFSSDASVALVCGPEVMMRFVVRELARRGVAEDRIYLAMERNMHCAVGFCGHCQLGPHFVCKDGPVLRCDRLGARLWRKEA